MSSDDYIIDEVGQKLIRLEPNERTLYPGEIDPNCLNRPPLDEETSKEWNETMRRIKAANERGPAKQ